MPQLDPSNQDRLESLEQDSAILPALLYNEIEKLKTENRSQQVAIERAQKTIMGVIALVAATLIAGDQVDKVNATLGKLYETSLTVASLYAGWKTIENNSPTSKYES